MNHIFFSSDYGIVDLFFNITKKMSHVKSSIWCAIVWSLWKSRNLKFLDEIDEVGIESR